MNALLNCGGRLGNRNIALYVDVFAAMCALSITNCFLESVVATSFIVLVQKLTG